MDGSPASVVVRFRRPVGCEVFNQADLVACLVVTQVIDESPRQQDAESAGPQPQAFPDPRMCGRIVQTGSVGDIPGVETGTGVTNEDYNLPRINAIGHGH